MSRIIICLAAVAFAAGGLAFGLSGGGRNPYLDWAEPVDFGLQSTRAADLEAAMRIQNRRGRSIRLIGAQVGCGCIEAKGPFPVLIPPGESGVIEIRLDARRMTLGDHEYPIDIFIEGGGVIRSNVSYTYQPLVELSPSPLVLSSHDEAVELRVHGVAEAVPEVVEVTAVHESVLATVLGRREDDYGRSYTAVRVELREGLDSQSFDSELALLFENDTAGSVTVPLHVRLHPRVAAEPSSVIVDGLQHPTTRVVVVRHPPGESFTAVVDSPLVSVDVRPSSPGTTELVIEVRPPSDARLADLVEGVVTLHFSRSRRTVTVPVIAIPAAAAES